MSHRDVSEAFDLLVGEIEAVLNDVREQAAEASRQGKYDLAQTLLRQAQEVEAFLADVRQKRQEWQQLVRGRRPPRGRKPTKRLPPGARTPEEAYRLPILRALAALGGEARVGDVLERVFAEMRDQLKPVDWEPLPSDPNTPRWRNAAQWERQRMVNEGLLANDSPRGVWAITEEGRDHLRRHGG